MKKLIKFTSPLFVLFLFLLPYKAEAKMEPGYTMTDVLCPCGVYKEACEPDFTDECDVSNQMFCYEVC
jgi:hypothetical protein